MFSCTWSLFLSSRLPSVPFVAANNPDVSITSTYTIWCEKLKWSIISPRWVAKPVASGLETDKTSFYRNFKRTFFKILESFYSNVLLEMRLYLIPKTKICQTDPYPKMEILLGEKKSMSVFGKDYSCSSLVCWRHFSSWLSSGFIKITSD